MTALAEKIYDEMLDLPAEQRLDLIDKLLESINPPVSSVHEAWIKEAERRFELYNKGEMPAVDGEEVFSRLQQRFSQ